MIREPGLYDDIDEETYHRGPLVDGDSLSSTEVKRLLDCPARYQYWKDRPEHREVFEFGRAAHTQLLGIGSEVVVLPFDDFRKAAAREARDEARDAGKTPVLESVWSVIGEMVAAVRAHRTASKLLDPEHGTAEQTAVWHDRVYRRARFDYRPERGSARPVIVDYKTHGIPANRRRFERSITNYDYDISAAWYLSGIRALTGEDAAFVYVVQEKEPPYLVSVFQLDPRHIKLVEPMCEAAVDLYLRCTETGIWPSYGSDDIELINMPEWAAYRWEDTA